MLSLRVTFACFCFLFVSTCFAQFSIVNPDSTTEWSIYYTACVEWDLSAPIFDGETTATFTLQTPETSVTFATSVLLSEESVEWKVYGVLPHSEAVVIMELDTSSTTITSNLFTVSLPLTSITNPCLGVVPFCNTDMCEPGSTFVSCDGGPDEFTLNCAIDPVVFINEIHYSNSGADIGEFVEVAGSAGLVLDDYDLILYNGNDGDPYDTIDLSGMIPDEGNGYGAVLFAHSPIQNGAEPINSDGIALVRILDNAVLEFISYSGTITAASGLAAGLTSTDIDVYQDNDTPVGESLQRTGCYTGMPADFEWVGPLNDSRGTLNGGQEFAGCA